MSEYKNISVRLSNEDYAKLEKVTDFYNANSYFKGSFADVLRIALNDKYTEVVRITEDTEKEEKKNKPKNKNSRRGRVEETALEETATTLEDSDVPEGQMDIEEVVGETK
jgi:hypothetical protein